MPKNKAVEDLLNELSSLERRIESLSRSKKSLNEKKSELAKKRYLFDKLVQALSEWSKNLTPVDLAPFQDSISRADALFTSISSRCGSHTLWGAKDELLKIKRNISPSLLNEAREQERRENEQKGKLRAFLKCLPVFSGKLLDGGVTCVGLEYVGVGGNAERLYDIFSQKRKEYGLIELKQWATGFSFKGKAVSGTYGNTSLYGGFNTKHLFLLSSKDILVSGGDIFADVAWLADDAPLCSLFFYAGAGCSFRKAHVKDLLGLFGRFAGVLGKRKATSMHVEVRMQENAKHPEARDFYNRLVSAKFGDGLELKTRYDSVAVVKKGENFLSGDKGLFSAKLYGYLKGDYKPFLEVNWDLCQNIYARRREGNASLTDDESPNIGGISISFKLPPGGDYPEPVLEYVQTILSFFEGKKAYARHKLGTPELEHAIEFVFSLDK